MKSKIAIVGHTNSGKTTLIRTLLRRPIGEVDDRANVTQLSDSQSFEDLHAILIDTPGFQNAAAFLSYLNLKELHGEEVANTIKSTISIDYEQEVANTIKSVDACIYVASLEVVPDESILSEISLVHSICSNIIVVLNKNREFSNKENKEEAERRIKLWTEGCENLNVNNIINFDAHWASPNKTYSFFEKIEFILPSDKKKSFRQGVSDFKNRQNNLRNKALEYALECIIKCRKKDLVENLETKIGESEDEFLDRMNKGIKEICENELEDFITKSCSLYALAGELPETEVDKFHNISSLSLTSGKVGTAAIIAGVFAGVFGLIGVFTGLLMSAVTIAGGASVGGAVGGGIGAIVGYAGAMNDEEKLKAIQAGYVAIICLNILWVLTCYGWGKGAKIPKDIMNAINSRINRALPGIDPINWDKANSDEMKNWMTRFLDRISI